MIDKHRIKIEELVDEIGDVYEGNDWLVVKKYLMKYLDPRIRKLFSTRNSKSKKHTISDFDQKIIDIYYHKFGVRLKLDEAKKHKD